MTKMAFRLLKDLELIITSIFPAECHFSARLVPILLMLTEHLNSSKIIQTFIKI